MRMRWLANILLPILQRKIADRRDPDFMVTRDDGRQIYLKRWWVIKRDEKRRFNLYLHNMLLDDDAVLHDHPYWSLSLVLTDGLTERYIREPESCFRAGLGFSEFNVQLRDIPAGKLVYRSEKFAHQLIVRHEAWTLFFTGPRMRNWGFWCPRGWRRWQDYVAPSQDPSGRNVRATGVGVGCGEP